MEPRWGSQLAEIMRLGSPATVQVSLAVLPLSYNRRFDVFFSRFIVALFLNLLVVDDVVGRQKRRGL